MTHIVMYYTNWPRYLKLQVQTTSRQLRSSSAPTNTTSTTNNPGNKQKFKKKFIKENERMSE